MKTKKIGDLTIVADEPILERDYTTPDGKVLSKEELWKGNTFFEQDYFNIQYLKNLHVRNEQNQIITPIISEVDVKNSGYVCTWHQVFWVQGYVVFKNQIYFAGLGEDSGYYCRKPKWYKLSESAALGKLVDFSQFIDKMVEPCHIPQYDGTSTLDDLPNPGGLASFLMSGASLADFMLVE